MRLDDTGIGMIQLLEKEYGQLSNVPTDNTILKKLSVYGGAPRAKEKTSKKRVAKKRKPNEVIQHSVTFYISDSHDEYLLKASNNSDRFKAVVLRKWISEISHYQSKITISTNFKKDKKIKLNMNRKDALFVIKQAKHYETTPQIIISNFVKNKINELQREE